MKTLKSITLAVGLSLMSTMAFASPPAPPATFNFGAVMPNPNVLTGSSKAVLTGVFTGTNGTLTGFSGRFFVAGTTNKLNFSNFTSFTGTYDVVTGALTSLDFKWKNVSGFTGVFRNIFNAKTGADRITFNPTGNAGTQTVKTSFSFKVPEIDGSGLPVAGFLFAALLVWISSRGTKARNSSLAA